MKLSSFYLFFLLLRLSSTFYFEMLRRGFKKEHLYECEKQKKMTLWHFKTIAVFKHQRRTAKNAKVALQCTPVS